MERTISIAGDAKHAAAEIHYGNHHACTAYAMIQISSSFVWDALSVVAITLAVRWLLTVRGTQEPKVRGDICVYDMKWQLRLLFMLAAAGLLTTIVGFWNEFFEGGPYWPGLLVFGGFFLFSLYAMVGSVQTDQRGIRKRVLFLVHSLDWNEITEVRVNKNPGGSIELDSRNHRLTIDFRFVARDHLLNEIARRTGLRPIVRGARTEPAD